MGIPIMLCAVLALQAAPPAFEGAKLPAGASVFADGRITREDPARGPGEDRQDLRMRRIARRGAVASRKVPAGEAVITDAAPYPAGRQAYEVTVPAGGFLKASLDATHRAWFRVLVCSRTGDLEQGMLQNLIHSGDPVATYRNLGGEARTVFVLVDTSTCLTSAEPYTLTLSYPDPPAKP